LITIFTLRRKLIPTLGSDVRPGKLIWISEARAPRPSTPSRRRFALAGRVEIRYVQGVENDNRFHNQATIENNGMMS